MFNLSGNTENNNFLWNGSSRWDAAIVVGCLFGVRAAKVADAMLAFVSWPYHMTLIVKDSQSDDTVRSQVNDRSKTSPAQPVEGQGH